MNLSNTLGSVIIFTSLHENQGNLLSSTTSGRKVKLSESVIWNDKNYILYMRAAYISGENVFHKISCV